MLKALGFNSLKVHPLSKPLVSNTDFQLDLVLKALVFQAFNSLKVHPLQAVGFKYQPAPPLPRGHPTNSAQSAGSSQLVGARAALSSEPRVLCGGPGDR